MERLIAFLMGKLLYFIVLVRDFCPDIQVAPDLGLGYRLALIPPMMFVPLLKLLWDVVGNPVERY